jgi:hypothetical protein
MLHDVLQNFCSEILAICFPKRRNKHDCGLVENLEPKSPTTRITPEIMVDL